MKEDEGQTKEVKANPYNKEKYWHKEEDMPKTFRSADEGPADANTDVSTGFNYATNSNVNPDVNTELNSATSDKSLQ